ncbi:MAG: FAD-dependent oxidoreductase [Pseudomonadota bacterium]
MKSKNTTTQEYDCASNRRRFLKWGMEAASVAAIGAVSLPTAAAVNAVGADSDLTNERYLDVVIIGAGLAGLTAARDLQRAGNSSFLVLEARDRVGGRILNHELADGHFSEAGGQWIGPGQTAIFDLARELDVKTFDSVYAGKTVLTVGQGKFAADTGGSVDGNPEITAELDIMASKVPSGKPWTAENAAEWDQTSLGEWLENKEIDAVESATWSLASLMTTGTAPSKVSLLHYLSMVNSAGTVRALESQKDGAQETRFHGGSSVLTETMADALEDKLILNCPVREVREWDTDSVKVVTDRGVVQARRVILALSPPLCEQIAYSPALPAPRRALQRQWPAHAPMCKTAMVYPRPFWRSRGYNGQVSSLDGLIAWSYDNSPYDASLGVINAFVRVAELPGDKEEAKTRLAQLYADAMDDERLLAPTEFHLHDWGEDDFTLSCVSPMPPGLLTSGLMPALTENAGSLIWSGTETADIWAGYMDGAVRSGRKAALQALQALSVKGCA